MSTDNWGIAGHEWAVATLQRAIAAERVPHALLFAGPPGIGKRTLAMAVARALQCSAPDPSGRPCGICRPCVQIAAGNYPDVRLIETERSSSSQRSDRRDISIDQIRALQHQVGLKPYESKWVIGVIADAHEMSDAAANCLLKTLEEPQAHAVLILTAQDVGQLLPTIVSRCQVFLLRPLPVDEEVAEIQRRSGLSAQQSAVLAQLSGGRIGWAIQAAHDDSVLTQRNQRLDALLNLQGSTRRQRLAQAATLADDYARGQDGRESVHETLDLWATWWRDVLLIQQGCQTNITNADRVADLQSTAGGHRAADVARFLADIVATRSYLERNVSPRLALEVLVLDVPSGSSRQI
jgi:DNA polymerase III subunit delta'